MTKYELLQRRNRNKKLAFIKAIIRLPIAIPLLVFSPLAPFIAVTIAARKYDSMMRGDQLILWLRRFGDEGIRNHLLANALLLACRGLGVCVTLRDKSIRGSRLPPIIAVLRNYVWYGWASWALMFIPISAVYFSFFSQDDNSEGLTLALSMFILWPLASWVLAVIFHQVRGYHMVRQDKWTADCEKFVRQIRKKKGSWSSLSVVKCADRCWQDVIHKLLEVADAVVFDSDVLSESLRWEFGQSLEILGPGKIIIAKDGSSDQITLFEDLREEFGFDFEYVSHLNYRDGASKLEQQEMIQTLEDALAKALTTPRRHGEDTTRDDDNDDHGGHPKPQEHRPFDDSSPRIGQASGRDCTSPVG